MEYCITVARGKEQGQYRILPRCWRSSLWCPGLRLSRFPDIPRMNRVPKYFRRPLTSPTTGQEERRCPHGRSGRHVPA
eukprot:2712925-Heterocapsa_arctica.AAC.1